MTPELLSLAKYLASSRAGFALSEMNLYLDKKYEEKELYEILKPRFYDLDLFCSTDYKCTKLVKRPLPADDFVIRELDKLFKKPQLPARIEKLIGSYIEGACGKGWHRGKTAALIRENIVRQKEEYWKRMEDSRYPKIRIVSYLLYHFPVYFCQFQFILLELLKNGLLSNKMSFLDVGSGPGTITLSTLDFLRKLLDVYSKKNMDVKLNIRIGSIERAQENVDCYNELTALCLSGIALENANIAVKEPVRAPVETAPVAKDADLIIFSNVLAEMRSSPAERADAVERFASGSKNPTIIIIEPADLINSKALRVAQHALIKKGFTVFSPCTFLWGKICGGGNCWSFQELGNIRAPGFMKKIAETEDSYRYINTDMKFSSVVLRKNGKVLHPYIAMGKFMRLANLKKHIEKRVNIAASVMSGNLGDEKTFVFKVCDGTTSVPCYAVLPAYHISDNNKMLFEAGYGGIIEVYGTLVRENSPLSSYNLLITRNTMVRPAG
ncbi:MAG: small ribosomal subunit Rsm22 family protein [Euryarchaeota archaeon]|nr:small ribosomal subunit Rsm22 family protein [Euryarchaeota archaeon]